MRHEAECFSVKFFRTEPIFIKALADLVIKALDERPVLFSDTVRPQDNVKLYPQERWAWGITPSAEVWNGRIAMLLLLEVSLELWLGQKIRIEESVRGLANLRIRNREVTRSW